RRCRHAPLLAACHQITDIACRHLRALRLSLRAPFELAPLLARQLVNQIGRFATDKVQRFEHRIALVEPSPRMRFGGTE
ncbi:MAG TPA: hypothetical protein VFQ06_13345, partial [Nitrospira sp.]|nr:hypothetical protein [Nitrospira sp.]